MVMKMLRHGFQVENAPSHEYSRKFGDSHINIFLQWPKLVWSVLINLLRRDVARQTVPGRNEASASSTDPSLETKE